MSKLNREPITDTTRATVEAIAKVIPLTGGVLIFRSTLPSDFLRAYWQYVSDDYYFLSGDTHLICRSGSPPTVEASRKGSRNRFYPVQGEVPPMNSIIAGCDTYNGKGFAYIRDAKIRDAYKALSPSNLVTAATMRIIVPRRGPITYSMPDQCLLRPHYAVTPDGVETFNWRPSPQPITDATAHLPPAPLKLESMLTNEVLGMFDPET